jgi:hypothetical protein
MERLVTTICFFLCCLMVAFMIIGIVADLTSFIKSSFKDSRRNKKHL